MTTNNAFSAVEVNWVTPADIVTVGATVWDRIRIYRSTAENSGYTLIQQYSNTILSISFSINPTNTVNAAAHGLLAGDLVGFNSVGGDLPSSLVAGIMYYVVNPAPNTFQVARAPGGTPLLFSTAGTGTLTATKGEFNSEIASQVASIWQTLFSDTTVPSISKDNYYYLIRYYNSAADIESKFYLTFKTLSPREQRIIQQTKMWITPWVANCMTDDDIRGGLALALNAINIQPPLTSFDINNFPINLEPLLIPGTAIFTLMFKYLGVAFTDISYSDNGLSLTIDRGAKVKTAIDTTLGYYNQMLSLAKLEYSFGGTSVGTVPLPMSIGGNIGKSVMNVFDLFNATGR